MQGWSPVCDITPGLPSLAPLLSLAWAKVNGQVFDGIGLMPSVTLRPNFGLLVRQAWPLGFEQGQFKPSFAWKGERRGGANHRRVHGSRPAANV